LEPEKRESEEPESITTIVAPVNIISVPRAIDAKMKESEVVSCRESSKVEVIPNPRSKK
jgi:hypothetical protein